MGVTGDRKRGIWEFLNKATGYFKKKGPYNVGIFVVHFRLKFKD